MLSHIFFIKSRKINLGKIDAQQAFYILCNILIENIQKSVNDKDTACGVFLDLEKASDFVDHTLFLNKYLIMVLELLQVGGSNLT